MLLTSQFLPRQNLPAYEYESAFHGGHYITTTTTTITTTTISSVDYTVQTFFAQVLKFGQ